MRLNLFAVPTHMYEDPSLAIPLFSILQNSSLTQSEHTLGIRFSLQNNLTNIFYMCSE